MKIKQLMPSLPGPVETGNHLEMQHLYVFIRKGVDGRFAVLTLLEAAPPQVD